MPKLKRYVSDSEKSGVYIVANVGGNHPVTLQVTSVGRKILNKAGYNPEDAVPTEVVWSMYDVGLVYTSNVVNNPPEVEERTDEIFDQLGVSNNLTRGERQELLSHLKKYDGPNQGQVAALRDDLQQTQSEEVETETGTQSDDPKAGIARLITLRENGDISEEEYRILKSQAFGESSKPDPPQTNGSDSDALTGEDDFLKLELTGLQYYESSNDLTGGIFCSFIAESKEFSIDYWGKYLSGRDGDGFIHEAKSKSSELKKLNKEDFLTTPWKIKDSSTWSATIPHHGKIKTLAHIPCPQDTKLTQLSYEYGAYSPLQDDTEDVEEAGLDPRSNQRITISLSNWDSLVLNGLPDEVDEAMQSLGYTPIKTY